MPVKFKHIQKYTDALEPIHHPSVLGHTLNYIDKELDSITCSLESYKSTCKDLEYKITELQLKHREEILDIKLKYLEILTKINGALDV